MNDLQEGLTQEKLAKAAAETDISFYKEEIEKLRKENEELRLKLSPTKENKEEEIESQVTNEEIQNIPVLSYVTGEPFTGNNVEISQLFRKYLIENNKAAADEEIRLISQAEAERVGGRIKDGAEACVLKCPPNEEHEDWWQENYYYINDTEDVIKQNINNESKQNLTNMTELSEVGTKLPDGIAIITQKGIKEIGNISVLSISTDGSQITIGNNEESFVVEQDTFKELMKTAEKVEVDKSVYEKLPETMYNDYFNPRDPNCADYFRHNLSVFCRQKANSPIDALELSKQIIEIMPKEEQKRTKKLLEKCCKPGQGINEVLIDIYEDAVKEVPLCEEWIKNNASGKYIPRQLTDIITANQAKIDRDSELKIGDTLNDVVINNRKVFGNGKEKINVGNLKIISASKENNSITLMGEDKSYYELPRDTVLAAYQQQTLKQKHTNNKSYSMEIDR